MKISAILYLLKHLNIKTVYFNLKVFPFQTAIRFPVFLSKKVVLKNCSGSVIIPENFYSGMIKIGFGDVGIFDRKSSRTIWENKGQIIFQGRADIGHGSKICVGKNGELLFGKQFVITAESSIICFNKIFFGERCLLSWDTLIMDTDFHKIYFNDKVINQNQQIVIGNKIWIGARSTILKGVAIASNSVVAAGSVVNKTFTDESVLIAGVPARVVKENISWEI